MLAQSGEQPNLCFVPRCLHVNRDDVSGQPGQKPRSNQRRLAAARRTVDQADGERVIRVGLFDASLPEADAVRQALPVPRTGEQLQKEISVVGVKGPQAFGNDLDRVALGGRSGWRRQARRSVRGQGGQLHRRRLRRTAVSCSRRYWLGGLVGQEVPEIFAHVPCGRVAFRCPLGKGLQANAFQFSWNRIVPLPGRACLRRNDLFQ